jgi:sulfoxide reductase heme-binding subunit YedZ
MPFRLRFTRLHLLMHLAALTPLGLLIFDAFTDNLTANPIQAATQRTGLYALSLLLVSLLVTPLYTLTRWGPVVKMRRPLGLYAFLYAAIHVSIFVGIDYAFAWNFMLREIPEKRYILVGLSAFLILAALAFTSSQYWMKRLGKSWKRLHKLVYLAGPLVILHFAWAVKGDLALLSGEVLQPLLYGLALVILLVLRLPPVRRRLSALSRRLKPVRQVSTGRKRPSTPPTA